MRLLLTFALLFCMGNALFANSPGATRFPAGNLTSVDFSAESGPCTGICQPARTWVFEGGRIIISGASSFSFAGGIRSINLVAGTTATFYFDAPQQAVGINTDSDVAWTLSAAATIIGGTEAPASRAVAAGADIPFVTADSPYENYFNVIAFSTDVDVTFAISTFIYGRTGFNCVGFEEEYPCELTVNSINLPNAGSNITIYQNTSSTEPLYTVVQTGGKKVLMCVPEDPINPFRAVVTDNGVPFDTAAESVNQPVCTQLHQCYLDPRAALQIPIDCLPQSALNDYANGLTVSVTVAWQGTVFRTMDLVGVNPSATVLAVNNIVPGLATDGQTVTTAEEYNCGKGAVSPPYGADFHGDCVYPLYGNDFSRFPSLTGQLVIRAKCSAQQEPPMVEDVTLYITPVANSIQYTIPNRGNEDTEVCVLNFGEYNVWAIENQTSTNVISVNCPNDATSTSCNGTPLDVVSSIYAAACVQGFVPCESQPGQVSAGGNTNGYYPVYLAQAGVLFRTEMAAPFGSYGTCVLNTNAVSLTMPVTANAGVVGEYDCTERAADILHPTQNVCKRLGDDDSTLQLFNLLSVDLNGLPENSISYDINLLTTSDGANFIQTNLPARPEGSFCNRGGAVDQICVPALGSDPLPLPCGQSFQPTNIQVFAEECGANTVGPSVNCPSVKREDRTLAKDQLHKRDDGICVTTSDTTDCRKTGICNLPITQDLCIWDLLYLDTEYPAGSRGVVVELTGPQNLGVPVRTYDNQGGCPQTYKVLQGFNKVKIIENPAMGDNSDPNSPYVLSPAIQCQAEKSCVYNDFLSILDLTGGATVGQTSISQDDPTVTCAAITYVDNYSLGPRLALDYASVGLSVKGSTTPFRPLVNLGRCGNGARDCADQLNNAVVLKTQNFDSYSLHYNWAAVNRVVEDLTCTSKACGAVPCLVRWAAVDPACPDLRFQAEFLPTGVQPDNNDDPHRDLYKYTSIVTAPTATINGQALCSETIAIGSTRDTACRKASFTEEYAPTGFSDNDNMYRYFMLAKDGEDAYNFTIHAGCSSAIYGLDCPYNVADSGRKAFNEASVAVPNLDCTPATQQYWHTCKFVDLAENLKAPDQYWRTNIGSKKRVAPTPVVTSETCLESNDVSSADPWCPLSPYTVVSVDLTELPNGTVSDADSGNLTNSNSAEGAQRNYRGQNYQNDDINTNAGYRNSFDLSICCDNCGVDTSSMTLKEQHGMKKRNGGYDCGNGRINAAAGYDHLVCILANADYSYKLEERYRNEKRRNFLPLNPDICPRSDNRVAWTQAIEACRPNYCEVKNTGVPVRYPSSDWTNFENKLEDNINWRETYSTNFQCPGTPYSHTLLRGNRLARPAEANIPYIKSKWYEFRVNNPFSSSHSDKFTCIDNTINPGYCFEKDNDLASSLPSLRSEPQE